MRLVFMPMQWGSHLFARRPVAKRPALNAVNRFLHRLYVRRQDVRDKRAQVNRGLSSFPADWDRHVRGVDTPPRQIPQVIWMLWLQGEDAAPPLVQASFESWRRHNPAWDVIVLDREVLSEHVSLPNFPDHLRMSHIANIVRLQLLARYGGVWADATTLCLRPLDSWIDSVTPTGFFAFARPQPLRALATWFVAAEKQSPFVHAWLRWSRDYVLRHKEPDCYHWMHHTFNWLLRRNRRLRLAWHRTPRISARGPHILQRILDGHLEADAAPTSDEMTRLPLVKLNWKKGYTLRAINLALEAHGITLEAVR